MVKKEALINNNIDDLKRLSNYKKEETPKTLRRAQGQVDYLIIGQGISGTWLSYYLQQEGRSFSVIDNHDKNSASRLAAGIINPVTGRRHVKVWMADEILPFAQKAYAQLGNELGLTAISQKNIIDFFPGPQMRVSFMQRVEEKAEYVYDCVEHDHYRRFFNYDFGCGEIKPVYTVHLETLLPAWRQQLLEKDLLIEAEFELSQLNVTPGKIEYNDITAGKIIFCDGPGCTANPYFDLLPFAPNKGELLIVSIPDLPPENIYKKGMMLAPLATPGLWWVGSSYAWEFDQPDPTPAFRERTEALLKQWLKIPFTIEEHLAGIRPATLERRPFAGLHPLHAEIGILNGMGTKGCSLAPFFAKQLADHLCHGKQIDPDADIVRFRKILSRKNP
ncbi:MAG TPA: FAD-binding oxidoreductase [Chitinophagaceae bacterium]|jgi:glycine/D-amino acid oxidase-like deaminating enzyme|nr:FAD-binding oxidoreductase [Chitinophagaceae bacterium]